MKPIKKLQDNESVNYNDLTPEQKKAFIKSEIARKRKFFREEKTIYKNFSY